MPNLQIGNKTAEARGTAASGCKRYVFTNVRRSELPSLIDRVKSTPGYCTHRSYEQADGTYTVFAYICD